MKFPVKFHMNFFFKYLNIFQKTVKISKILISCHHTVQIKKHPTTIYRASLKTPERHKTGVALRTFPWEISAISSDILNGHLNMNDFFLLIRIIKRVSLAHTRKKG
jgi:hypothetical protein